MLAAHGLYGHIRNNDLRATALLAGFALYVGLLWIAACLLFSGLALELGVVSRQLETGRQLPIPHWLFGLKRAKHIAIAHAWLPVLILAGWLSYAWLHRGEIVRKGTGARPAVRALERDLYNTVEALAIAAGLPVPAVEIIESEAPNACASGWTPADSTVAVTRGLLDSLSKDELEAVIAHEITHIRNRDVRLMTVAAIFVGCLVGVGRTLGAGKDGTPNRNLALRTSGGAGIFFAVAAVVVGSLASALAALSRLALSRTREFVADAGAVALTKNPDALIRALEKIAACGEMPAVPAELRAMMIFSAPERWWATHPSIESRIAALEMYAGGRCTVSTRAKPAPAEGSPPGLRRIPAAAVAAPTIAKGRSFGRRVAAP